jgi:Na+/H+ antiporter NhaD/arsenite permease-like protein
VTIAFVLHGVLHYEPSVVALLGAGTLMLVARRDPNQFLREVEWPTLLFFMGLFIMAGALVKAGVIGDLAGDVIAWTDGNLLVATLVILGVSAVLSALVDNIPYVATMGPLVHELVRSFPATDGVTVLWWALALGADLGGNATAIGASANVVILGIAERSGNRIRFLEFAKYGIVVAGVTIVISALYLWVRYFLFA